jgi:phosphonatase-like hydrolase
MGAVNLVVFDIAGTTAKDDGLVLKAAQRALVDMGIEPGSAKYEAATAHINSTMGQRKIDVFLHIFNQDKAEANAAHELFVANYQNLVASGEVAEFSGVSSLFHALRAASIGVAITTGFPRAILNVIIEGLNWRELIDFDIAADEVENGRPAPDMILRSLAAYNQANDLELTPQDIAVAGDTESDMAAGVAAAAQFIVGVTTGDRSEEQLFAAGATHVLHDITKLLALVS